MGDSYIDQQTGKKYDCKNDNIKYCLLKEILTPKKLSGMNIEKILEGKHIIGDGAIHDVCGCDNYCGLKAIAEKNYTRKQFEQMRCIDDYKYLLNEKRKEGVREITRDEAAMDWVLSGFAKAFKSAYENKKHNHEMIRHWDLYIATEKELRKEEKEEIIREYSKEDNKKFRVVVWKNILNGNSLEYKKIVKEVSTISNEELEDYETFRSKIIRTPELFKKLKEETESKKTLEEKVAI